MKKIIFITLSLVVATLVYFYVQVDMLKSTQSNIIQQTNINTNNINVLVKFINERVPIK